jgi:hypothetical protein
MLLVPAKGISSSRPATAASRTARRPHASTPRRPGTRGPVDPCCPTRSESESNNPSTASSVVCTPQSSTASAPAAFLAGTGPPRNGNMRPYAGTSSITFDQAADHVHGGGLASTIGPQQTKDLATTNVEREFAHRYAVPVRPRETLDRKNHIIGTRNHRSVPLRSHPDATPRSTGAGSVQESGSSRIASVTWPRSVVWCRP